MLLVSSVTNRDGIVLRSLGKFIATSYCSCVVCCGKWAKYRRTAYGYVPQEGRTMAVDPSVLVPRMVYLIKTKNGELLLRAEDTGSAIKGRKIDIYHKKHRMMKDTVEIFAFDVL